MRTIRTNGWMFNPIGMGIIICILSVYTKSYSHGAYYEVIGENVIGIRVYFEGNLPMAHTPVRIFKPLETKPHTIKKTDENGNVFFIPDTSGTWILQVRDKGGHGVRVNILVDESMITHTTASSELSWTQKAIIVFSIVWGAIGTALYFKSRRE